MIHVIRRLAGVALILCGCLTAAASAQNAASKEPSPKPDPGTSTQSECISQKDGYVRLGKGAGFAIELTNRCDQRMKCRIFVYHISSKGPTQESATLILAPNSRGDAATKAYQMKVKQLGGMAQSSRECRVL